MEHRSSTTCTYSIHLKKKRIRWMLFLTLCLPLSLPEDQHASSMLPVRAPSRSCKMINCFGSAMYSAWHLKISLEVARNKDLTRGQFRLYFDRRWDLVIEYRKKTRTTVRASLVLLTWLIVADISNNKSFLPPSYFSDPSTCQIGSKWISAYLQALL